MNLMTELLNSDRFCSSNIFAKINNKIYSESEHICNKVHQKDLMFRSNKISFKLNLDRTIITVFQHHTL